MARTPRARSEPWFRSEERLVADAREFVTVGQEHMCWREDCDHGVVIPRGAFVRIDPPGDATDDQVQAAVGIARAAGAAHVRVLPRRKGAAVVASRAPTLHRRAREVVLEVVAESRFEEKDELRMFCETIMSRRGL